MKSILSRLRAGLSTKTAALLGAAASFGAVATAVALQLLNNWYPCPWCILQRYAYLALGVVLTAVVLTGHAATRRVLTWLAGLVALVGAAMASFQLSVMLFPSITCGRDRVAAFVNGLLPAQWLPTVFEATGSCIDPLPVNFPVLSLAGFSLVCLGLVVFSRRR